MATASGPLLLRRQLGGGARFVVVLEEADEVALVVEVGAQVAAHRPGILVEQAVVEPLVVAEVEAELLQLPLEVPVRLGDEQESGMLGPDGADHLGPVLLRPARRRPDRPRSGRTRR